jgi:hypothetical protein
VRAAAEPDRDKFTIGPTPMRLSSGTRIGTIARIETVGAVTIAPLTGSRSPGVTTLTSAATAISAADAGRSPRVARLRARY